MIPHSILSGSNALEPRSKQPAHYDSFHMDEVHHARAHTSLASMIQLKLYAVTAGVLSPS